jgi:hypothetical protein
MALIFVALLALIVLSYFYGADSRLHTDRGWVGGERD